MEEEYLKNLTDSAKKKLSNYNLYAQEFGLINTLFIKKILERDDSHLFIQLPEPKKLYLPIVTASFIFLYEKSYQEDYTQEFNIGDKVYWKGQRKTYSVIAKNEDAYTLSREHIGTDRYGLLQNRSLEVIHPRIKDCRIDYIKVNRDTQRDSFNQLIEFLKTHLKIKEVIANVPYKIGVICSINEFKNEIFKNTTHKSIIPCCYLTKEGKEENNLPIDPLIYVASDYQTIRKHIFDKDEKLEAVIFFDKYNNAEIINKDIRGGQLKRAIFIGEDDLEFKHDNLLKWRWSVEEFCKFHSQDFLPARITPIYVENPQLLSAINRFIADIEQIEKEYVVQFSALKQYAKRALLTVIPESNFFCIREFLFNDLYSAGCDKDDIDDYADIFQDSYQDIIQQVESLNNSKIQRLHSFNNFDYLIVSKKHKEIWQQKIPDKNILTYAEWKRNKDKNKRVLFLGLYGYFHYQTMRNSFDKVSILIYADSYEQKSFEYYENKCNSEIEDEYHSNDRKILSGLSYPSAPKTYENIDAVSFDDIEYDSDTTENRRTYQREDIFLKFIFEDSSSEILPISRHVLIQQDNVLITDKLENIKVGDVIGVYHNFNKDKLEEIATPKQKQAILECKACAELWKKPLINFYRSKNYIKERLLFDLQSKGADIRLATLNNWLDMNDKTLFPSKAKNIIAIGELINDDKFNANLKEISKKRILYRSIMITLGRDFSDAISEYITNKERTYLLRNFSDEKIEKILKENINFKKLIKITEPNAKEQAEQISLIFQDDNSLVNNEKNQIEQGEDTVTNEEFEALVKESEYLAKEAKEQADNLDDSIEELESDIKNKLDTVINENAQLKEEIQELREKLQQAENKIDSLGTMQIKHHEAIRQLIKSFTGLNTKVENLKSALK